MNKKGSAFFAVVLGLIVFMIGVLFIEHLGTDIVSARIDLSCSSAGSISDGNKFTCLLVDTVVPYFILVLLSLTAYKLGSLLR